MRDLRALPVPQRCYVLGPAGTFSEAGAQLYARAFEASGLLAPAIAYTASIEDAIAALAQDPAAVAIVPIENSESGTVVVTQEELRVARVRIEWELAIDVRYNLIGQGPLDRVRRIYCHPVAQGQCTRYLRQHLAQAEVIYASSNAQAGADLLSSELCATSAAIVPAHPVLAEWASFAPLAQGIQNSATNTTRFLVVRAEREGFEPDYGREKTSLVVIPRQDRPGLLARLLEPLGRLDLNITRIESRPSRDRPWAYVFFLDFQNGPASAQAVDEIRASGDEVIVLGTYDALR
jgi:chorismate mutase/prephenate dehydratase